MGWFSRDNNRPESTQTDQQAVERYRYMLRTAPPEQIEQAHQEAFEQLTPEQRRLALEQLASVTPGEERRMASDDPKTLARMATRAEIRQPGIMERLFGNVRSNAGGLMGGAGGLGFGGTFAGSLLASLAGTFIASSIAHSFFDAHPYQDNFSGEGLLDPESSSAAGYDHSSIDEGDTEPDPDAFEGDDFDGVDFGDGGDFGDLA